MAKLKAAVVIAHYGNKNNSHLQRVLAEWEGMTGIEAELTLVTEANLLPGENPAALPFKARPILAEKLNKGYDLFVFSEDDMLITEKNLAAWFSITAGWIERHEVAGFIRYEVAEPSGEKRFPDMHNAFHWENLQRREGELFAQFTNGVAACYLLTGWQLQLAIASGGFLVGPHADSTYGTLERGSADPYLQCGLARLICLSRFAEFIVHHLPDNYLHLGKPEAALRAELSAMGAEWK